MPLVPNSRSQFSPDPTTDTAIETLRKMINGDINNLMIESPDGKGTVYYTTDPAVAEVLKMVFEENESLLASEGQDTV